jgi:hypothetical protein
MPIGRDITKIDENLFGLEIDPEYEMENNFNNLMKAVDKLLPKSDGGEEDMDLSMLPGLEELFSLLRIQQIYESGEYDIIIVDCAPTGETLSLLKFPELFSWYMEKLFPVGKFAMRLLHPVSQKLFKVELPDGKAMNDIEKLYLKLVELQQELARKADVVMDGRDIGTYVLPNADLKIYLTASTKERAKRRWAELKEKGTAADMNDIEKDIIDRDNRDMSREFAPLRQAEDAVYLDLSEMTIDEVVEKIISFYEKVLKEIK